MKVKAICQRCNQFFETEIEPGDYHFIVTKNNERILKSNIPCDKCWKKLLHMAEYLEKLGGNLSNKYDEEN